MSRQIALAALLLLPGAARAASSALDLPIGDPARREAHVEVTVDAIRDAHSGQLLGPAQLAARLAGTSILLVGEEHTDADFHAVQAQVLRALVASGRKVAIGLEMYPVDRQADLDRWVGGGLDEAAFVRASHWYEAWGYPWDYYREIFVLARDHKVPMFALNVPRELVRAVREGKVGELPPAIRQTAPPAVDTGDGDHRRLFATLIGADDAEGSGGAHAQVARQQLDSMFAAQCTWDAAMGFQAVESWKRLGDPKAILVVLVGSGHVAYGLGIERQAKAWFPGEVTSLIPLPVKDADGEPVGPVRASYADLIWGLPPSRAPLFPVPGLSTTDVDPAGPDDRRKVIFVEEGSPAAKAGLAPGDVLLTLDGTPLPDRETLQRLLAEKRWGDVATFRVQRAGAEVEVPLTLRRSG